MLSMKKQLYKHISDVSYNAEGTIGLGITRGFGTAMLKKMFPIFHARYPNYRLNLLEGNVRELEKAVDSGTIDFAVVGCCSAHTALEHVPFAQSEIVIVLPPCHPFGRLAAPVGKPLAKLDLQKLREDRFILMNQETNVRAICDYHFSKIGFSPNIIMEVSLSSLAYSLVRSGVGVSILMLRQISPDDGVHCFSLRPREIWNYSVAFRKETTFTKTEEYFIQLVREYFSHAEIF
jgi:DNA-binding transcriptional LysR family regulator